MKVTVKVMRISLCLQPKQEDLRVARIRKREKALKNSKNVSMAPQKHMALNSLSIKIKIKCHGRLFEAGH